MAVDMVWNILSVISRVIALALFASFELYWFWGLVISQIVIIIIAYSMHQYRTNNLNGRDDFLFSFISNSFMGMGSIFTMLTVFDLTFQVYLM